MKFKATACMSFTPHPHSHLATTSVKNVEIDFLFCRADSCSILFFSTRQWLSVAATRDWVLSLVLSLPLLAATLNVSCSPPHRPPPSINLGYAPAHVQLVQISFFFFWVSVFPRARSPSPAGCPVVERLRQRVFSCIMWEAIAGLPTPCPFPYPFATACPNRLSATHVGTLLGFRCTCGDFSACFKHISYAWGGSMGYVRLHEISTKWGCFRLKLLLYGATN